MPRESKGDIKRSVAVSPETYEWVMQYADEHGMNYTATINFLLAEARKEIERVERIRDAHEEAMIIANDQLIQSNLK